MSSLSAKSLHHPSVCQFKNKPLSFISSQHQEEPIKQGFLWKKGNLRKNWKKRWFVLHFNALAYFEKADVSGLLIFIQRINYLFNPPVKRRPRSNTTGRLCDRI